MSLKSPFLLIFLLASLSAEMSAARRRVTTKRFQCQVCDYSTNRKGNITAHERTHTGEKPFKCQFCEHRAANKMNVTAHERTHTGEKPYKCQFCDHSTAKKSDITRHERTHTGEKPYKCQFCDHRATRKCNLVRHQRTHDDMPVLADGNFVNNKPTENLFNELLATCTDDPAPHAVEPATTDKELARRRSNES